MKIADLIFILLLSSCASLESNKTIETSSNEIIPCPLKRKPNLDFEGIIEYQISYIPKDGQSVKTLEKQFGKSATTYIKNGFYKELSNSSFMNYQVYRSADTAVYFTNQNRNDTLTKMNVYESKNEEKVYSFQDHADTILGYECTRLRIEGPRNSYEYYYNKNLSIDPSGYENFGYSDKNKVTKMIESVYLRLRIESPSFVMDICARSIEPKHLDDREFDLPKHTIIQVVKL